MTNPTKELKAHAPEKTSLFWWLVAIICSIIAVAVIIAGVTIFVGYLIIHPRIPVISVVNAHLYHFSYDGAGILVTQVNIVVESKNDNTKAHASFSSMSLELIFADLVIANLQAGPYEVNKNDSVQFNFLATSNPIPLNTEQMNDVDVYLNEDRARFELKGAVRARWRVGLLGSFKFQCHLNCELKFKISDGNYLPSKCTSKPR